MVRTDLLLDENYALKIEGGDFVVGESDHQNIQLLLASEKSGFKQFPTACIGVYKYINSPSEIANKETEIRNKLKADGYRLLDFAFTGGDFDINYDLISG